MRSGVVTFAAVVTIVPLALEGCLGGPQPDPSTFFLLSPIPPAAAGAPFDGSIGLGPITLPGYLDRPQIVVRLSDNQVALSEVERWAEPLSANLTRTLQENLQALLPGSSYVLYPWYASEAPDLAVAVELRRFESDATGSVVLEGTWTLTRDGARVDGRATRLTEAPTGTDRAAAVSAQSRALAALAAEIAGAVRRAGR